VLEGAFDDAAVDGAVAVEVDVAALAGTAVAVAGDSVVATTVSGFFTETNGDIGVVDDVATLGATVVVGAGVEETEATDAVGATVAVGATDAVGATVATGVTAATVSALAALISFVTLSPDDATYIASASKPITTAIYGFNSLRPVENCICLSRHHRILR
jgi:hypothetical protein